MDVSYQFKPLINNLNNISTVTTREIIPREKSLLEVKHSTLLNNKLSFSIPNEGSNSDSANSPFSFEDLLIDNDKERIDMVYDNSAIVLQGVNTYSLDLNLTKKDILELIKYFFSVYTIDKEETQELKYKIRNYSTEGLVKDIEYYINLVDKDAGFIKADNFSSFEKYDLWKTNELCESNKLHDFYKFYLNNKTKQDDAEPSHSKLIHLNILEAKNLKPKSGDKRFSNPYFIVEVGGKEFESQVIYKNVNPSWNFSTVIFLKETDTIKITLWNKVTGEEKYHLLDKTMNIFRSSKDHFLGQVVLTYNEVARYFGEKNVLDKWYVLEKRSSKSHISGEIRISYQFIDEKSLSISHSMFTFIPSCPNACFQYLIETVIYKELEWSKKNNVKFIGFSTNAQNLFNSCSMLWRINKLFILSKILNILLNEYISNNINSETLYNSVLKDIKENENIISPKENKRSIKQSLQRLYSYLSRHLSTFNEHFFETKNGTNLEKTLFLIEYLYRCRISEYYTKDSNAAYQYSQYLIQKGIVAKYHSIHASIDSNDPKIIRIIQLIPKIRNEINLYIERFPREERRVSIVHSSIEYFINQINDDISEFKVNPKLLKEDMTCSFDLISELVKLRNKCIEVDDNFKSLLNIDDYLIICIQEWLKVTNIKATEWINNSIKLDEFKPQMNEYISSSVIDVFTYCNQIFNYFINISWPDKKNLKNCLIHLVMIINKSVTVYLDGMISCLLEELITIRKHKFSRERIRYVNVHHKNFMGKLFNSEKSKGEAKVKRFESELNYDEENSLMANNAKVCIYLNNIHKCREELASLYERISKIYMDCCGNEDTTTVSTCKEIVLKTDKDNKYFKNMSKIESKYKSIMENRNDSYIIQPVQYINEKVESPFLNNYFITFSLMGTPNTLQNSAHTRAVPKYISTEIDENNIYYLELPKTNCTLDICIWHGTEAAGYVIYEKTCIVINRDDFVNQPMKEISVKFSDHSQLLVRIKLEDDFIYFYEKQINNIIDNLLIDLQRLLVRNMGGDICAAIGFIIEKFDNDLFRNRILTSDKLAHYSEPLVVYLQYNLNIFFDKLNSHLDPLNSIIHNIWLECLAIIRYTAIGELEHKSRSCNYEHVNSYPFLEQTKQNLTTDMLHSISSPGRVFKGKINERQIKYLSYVMEVLKELFNCGGNGIPYEKLEQKEFKEVRSILGHYPCDNKKLKVIFNHYMERNFSLYDHNWILNLLVAKGSSRFIKAKEHEMKNKLEKKLNGLNKKYESSISFYENHKRITSSSINDSFKIPTDKFHYSELDDDDELESHIGGGFISSSSNNTIGTSSYSINTAAAASDSTILNPTNRTNYSHTSRINVNENVKLSGYKNSTNDNIINNSESQLIKYFKKNMTTEYNNKSNNEGRLSIYNSRMELMNKNGLIDRNSNNRFNSNRNMILTASSNRNIVMLNNNNRNMMVMQQSSKNLMINPKNGNRMMMNQTSKNNLINIEMEKNRKVNRNGKPGRNVYSNRNESSIDFYDAGHGDVDGVVDTDRYGRTMYNSNSSDHNINYNDNGSSGSGNQLNRRESEIVITYNNNIYLSNQTLNDQRSNEEFIRDMMENFQKNSLPNILWNDNITYSSTNNATIDDVNTIDDIKNISYNNNNSFIKYNESNQHVDSRATLINNNTHIEEDTAVDFNKNEKALGENSYKNSRILKNMNINDSSRETQKMIPYVIDQV
ncbi:hypothetical protein BCR36DRAFT_342003 [Piromyces finnis]|uniref:C2 domain-containing protein n=1 Tax=Piromyces finnis TaxID=1754191 RepID=A0A1Y1VMA9_9FUNG|nr:hypothetical protein BCR36DRAFT_342003 [Piromyces finnis]|eukprot:ORX59909.1 hypothetical protein BCR36DRAFT_342003 [Piromyces finnis]